MKRQKKKKRPGLAHFIKKRTRNARSLAVEFARKTSGAYNFFPELEL